MEEAASRQEVEKNLDKQEAFYMKNKNKNDNRRGKFPKKSQCESEDSIKVDTQGKKKNKNTNLKCNYCGIEGHKASRCWKKAADKRREESSATVEEAMCVSVCADTSVAEEKCSIAIALRTDEMSSKNWCLDSGATSHMCNDESQFVDLIPIKNEKVKLANNESTCIKGKGTVVLCVKIDEREQIIRLNNTLFVPNLKTNLLSVSKASINGRRVIFDESKAVIRTHDDKVIAEAKRTGDLYTLKCFERESANLAEYDTTMDWHCRYGHLNEQDLRKLSSKQMVLGMPKLNTQAMSKCEVCILGKQSATPMPKASETKVENLLDVVHSDVCGPMRTRSIGGAKYFVTFVDGKSRWVDVYFLKSKSEVKPTFLKYKMLVENQKERKIKILRTDNGLEYCGKDFTDELEKSGIRRERTVEYTPQQNGVAERMNRTLVEMARCVMLQADLPNGFWAEAISTAAYIRNRCPTKPLVENMTPHEVWFGKMPVVSHFRHFGSKAFALNKRPQKGKFDPRSVECTMVGYSDESKAYRLWDPSSKKIIKSRDVKFISSLAVKSKQVFEFDFKNCDEDLHESDGSHSENEEDSGSVDECGNYPEGNCSDSVQGTKRGRGRPSKQRTGQPGRPKKIYNMVPIQDFAGIAVENGEEAMQEALSGPHAKEWKRAMRSEFDSLVSIGAWELVKCPDGRTPIGCRWVLKTKYNADGSVERRKARLVAKGYSQKRGVDFDETFAPVARMSSIRLIVALAAEYKLDLYQLDVTMAYTYGNLEEEIFMEQAEPFVTPGKEEYVYRLKRALYGLKQAGRQWFARLEAELLKFGLTQLESDPCTYFSRQDSKFLILVVYVDDLIVATNDMSQYQELKIKLQSQFKMRDLGPLKYCLGIEFHQDAENKSVKIIQKKYIQDIVNKFGLEDAHPALTPLEPKFKLSQLEESQTVDSIFYQSIIGSLMYAAIATRPDIMYAVSALSVFNSSPKRVHLNSAKRVLRYLKGTSDLGLFYKSTGQPLQGFVDSDWGSDVDTRCSRTGFVFEIAGAAVTWQSRKQRCVALSSTEAEYVALAEAGKEAMYLRNILKELKVLEENKSPSVIFCDNQSAAKLTKNPVHHDRSKHIDVKYHFIRKIYQSGHIDVQYLHTSEMPADVLTKSLCYPSHKKHTNRMGVLDYKNV